jgi:hypothetical protein
MKQTLRYVAILLLSAFLTACGGGGGSSSTAPTTFTPAPVQPSITIVSASLLIGFVNQPYADTVVATTSSGASYTITAQGSLPPGLALTNGNVLQGTPTQTGVFPVTFTATSTTLTTTKTLTIQIVNPGTVRNDSLASATPLVCCGNVRASLSPYSKATGVVAPDQDYYRFTANAGDRISVTTTAIGTEIDTDTVIEILDVNGTRMTTCKTPQVTTAFSQPCLNDDINPGIVRGSHLDVQLPATSGVFIVHVLDWAGRARPEMTYELDTSKLP